MLIKFLVFPVRCLFKGGIYLEGDVTFEITFLKSLTTVVVNCLCQKPVQIRVNVEKNVFFCYIFLAMAKGLNRCIIMLKMFLYCFYFSEFCLF